MLAALFISMSILLYFFFIFFAVNLISFSLVKSHQKKFFLFDDRLSRMITLLEFFSKALINCEARNPNPPVITIVLFLRSVYRVFTIANYNNF